MLQKDNLTRKLSQSVRVSLETSVNKEENPALYEQICEANLLRLVLDSSYFYSANYQLKDLNNIVKVNYSLY